MRRHRVTMVLAGVAAVWCAAPLAVTAASAGGGIAQAGTWRTAIEVPGLGSLNKGGEISLSSVSCGSAGNCAAGGAYRDGSELSQAFVASERNGRWGRAIEVPGSGALNAGAVVGGAGVTSVSCASAGNCAAGGIYSTGGLGDGAVATEAFVASERNGRWGRAIEVPGSGALNPARMAGLNSVSCASAGNCAAGGYVTYSFYQRAFVVSERNGTWGRARLVPGAGAVAGVKGSVVTSV